MDSIKVTENKLSGWSNTTYSSSKTYHPTKYEEIVEIFQFALSRNLTVSILGGKRSYSDNFLNTEISLDINKLNKIIELNGNELLVQSGVTFYDIAEFLDGKGLMIDHGTGIVIGETAIIKNQVRIYQGVTLGALSPKNSMVNPDLKRHPTIESNVIVYAGATILGDVVVGEGSIIGGNVWLTQDIPPQSQVFLKDATAALEVRKKIS